MPTLQIVYAANVVVNGTFDFDSHSNWMGPPFLRRFGDPFTITGDYFYHGVGGPITIFQMYNLTPSELADLSGPGLAYTMSANLFGRGDQPDNATFQTEFFDMAGGSGL